MKIYSLNIIINDNIINKNSPILYRMEDNDIHDIKEICQNKDLMLLIHNNIHDIFDINNLSYITLINYDTNTDEYEVEKINLNEIIDINNIAYEYIHKLSLILYKKTTGDDWKTIDTMTDIINIKKTLVTKFNISESTYCNCIMSMVNNDIEKTSDKSLLDVLKNIKNMYNDLLQL